MDLVHASRRLHAQQRQRALVRRAVYRDRRRRRPTHTTGHDPPADLVTPSPIDFGKALLSGDVGFLAKDFLANVGDLVGDILGGGAVHYTPQQIAQNDALVAAGWQGRADVTSPAAHTVEF
jgi:hypothetical protein